MRYGYYLVAFVDLLGQRDELMKITALPHTPEAKDQAITILKRTAGRVRVVRREFEQYFEQAKKSSGDHLDKLTPDQRAEYRRMRSLTFHQVGFSDSFVVAVPLGEAEFGPATAAIGLWSALYGLAGIMLVSLAAGVPLRAGFDVERGIDMFPNEVYGPALVSAYRLESTVAEYPRAVAGDGLLGYLSYLLELSPNNRWQMGAKGFGVMARDLICAATDDQKPMLHILSQMILNGAPQIAPQMMNSARQAFEWVKQERDRFERLQDDKHTERYARLLRYFNANGFTG